MDAKERELLTGMGNCYEACGEDFEATVGMVASSRRRTREDVKETLERILQRDAHDPEFQRLRGRLPASFPLGKIETGPP
jgi:hypothetical protein